MNWNIGLDIGTGGVRMAIRDRGVIFRQSAAIAWREGDEGALFQGNEAERLIARVPAGIAVAYPMSGDAVADERPLGLWFRYLLRHAAASNLVRRPRLLLSVPSGMQPQPVKHMVAMAMEAGAASCSVVRADLAAALGAPVDIMRPQATLLLDVGAGKMSVSVISGGRVVRSQSLPYGMRRVDEAIRRKLRSSRGMLLGPRMAEELKQALVGASSKAAPSAKMHAMHAGEGFPREFEITAEELVDASGPVVGGLAELAHAVVRSVDAELSADLSDGGMVLTGGGAHMYGLERMLAEALQLPCHVPEDPSACVIRGLATILDGNDKYDPLTTAHVTLMDKRG